MTQQVINAKEVVQRGAKLLDGYQRDWYLNVELDNLLMSSCSLCVLGQVFGEFEAGVVELEDAMVAVLEVQGVSLRVDQEYIVEHNPAVLFGFDRDSFIGNFTFIDLQEEWENEINKRLEHDRLERRTRRMGVVPR